MYLYAVRRVYLYIMDTEITNYVYTVERQFLGELKTFLFSFRFSFSFLFEGDRCETQLSVFPVLLLTCLLTYVLTYETSNLISAGV